MKRWIFSCLAVLAFGLCSQPAFAQAAQVPGLDAAIAKLFGNNTSFTASATARLIDDKKKETMTIPMNYALLDGKTRTEIDMTQVKSKDLEGDAGAAFKQMGMDKMVSIVRPDQKIVIVAYPALRAYAETPIPKNQAATGDEDYKIERTKIGAETIDGHPSTKNKVTITGRNNEKQEAVVWNASDLKDFPIRIEIPQTNGTMVMTYSNVKFEKPDPKLFEPPAGFEKHSSVEQLIQSAMMKMLAK